MYGELHAFFTLYYDNYVFENFFMNFEPRVITNTQQPIPQKVYKNETKDLPYNLFSCADIILGFMPKMSYVSYGRNYFPRGQTVADLGNGIQLWSGSVMAVKPGKECLIPHVFL